MTNKKITIVTPCYNSEEYLEECILSIKSQRYSNYEHIIIDGGSFDNTIEIIKKYENTYPMKWISEKDNGMYDAINKGFNMATGEIYAWINSDDFYLPWAFEMMNRVMQSNEILWCTTGEQLFADKNGSPYFINRTFGPCSYSRDLLRKGWYSGKVLGFVQQESTFWRKELWEKSGGLNTKYRYAGDYWLWVKFAEFTQLYSINTIISVFRRHERQLSENINAYYNEILRINPFLNYLGKHKILALYKGLFHPSHKYLIQIEKIK